MNNLLLRVAGFLTLNVALTGCVALNYETASYDMPPPDGLPACGDPQRNIESQCLSLVRAGDWHSPSGLNVVAGDVYCIEVPDGQVWFDKTRVNSPPFGEDGSALMNLYKKNRRVPALPWFSLIVAVAKHGEVETDTRPVVDDGKPCGKRGWRFEPKNSGMLVFYPNDAVLSDTTKMQFYGNNGGQIWVKLKRVR